MKDEVSREVILYEIIGAVLNCTTNSWKSSDILDPCIVAVLRENISKAKNSCIFTS